MSAAEDFYQACSTKRSQRTKADIEEIKKAIVDVVGADPPMTVRQVFYQLVTRSVIEKTEKEYQQTVIRLISDMRIAGELEWSWIIDERRRRRVTQTYDNLTEAVEDCARFYRRSALKQADDYLEVWCEKDALSGLLWDVTSDYDVPLMGDLQPLALPDTLDPLVVDCPARLAQQFGDLAIAIAAELPSKLDNIGGETLLVVTTARDLALCRAMLPERRTGATLGDMQLRSHLLNAGTATRGA